MSSRYTPLNQEIVIKREDIGTIQIPTHKVVIKFED